MTEETVFIESNCFQERGNVPEIFKEHEKKRHRDDEDKAEGEFEYDDDDKDEVEADYDTQDEVHRWLVFTDPTDNRRCFQSSPQPVVVIGEVPLCGWKDLLGRDSNVPYVSVAQQNTAESDS
ncbi:hypothetical protein RB195_000560 [Necator americanus]|uniref:Uncharacterized protein n=1 Tax=Necator americanus TaxID=51031 RepID=A0ABR1DC20_NECAM